MSWSIYASGDRDEAKRSVEQNENSGDDAAQHQAAKEYILRELELTPEGSTVSISASGHADNAGYRSANITLSASPKTAIASQP